MTEPTKFIPRVVTTNQQKISMQHPADENLPIIQKVNHLTWDHRFAQICSQTGYDTRRKVIKKLDIADWVLAHNLTRNPVTVFIEGAMFYNSINRQNLFVDFAKLRHCSIFRPPINYFTVHNNDEDSYRLHTILRRENYNLETKLWDTNAYNYQNSIMPRFTTKLISLMYDSPPPDINHVLIVAKDWYLLDPVQYLRSQLNVKVTLAISRTQSMSNNFLQQFDDYIELTELCSYAGALNLRLDHPSF